LEVSILSLQQCSFLPLTPSFFSPSAFIIIQHVLLLVLLLLPNELGWI